MQELKLQEDPSQDGDEISVSIPGIGRPTGTGRSLIALIDENKPMIPAEETLIDDDKSDSFKELKSILLMPLALLGILDSKSLVDRITSSGYQWTDDAVKLFEDFKTADNSLSVFAQLLGPWFARTVICDASDIVLQNRWEDSVIKPYLNDLPDPISWSILVSTVSVLASSSTNKRINRIASLSLCTSILRLCIKNGLLDPQRHVAGERWPEYLAIACSVPERLANRVDPRDIPDELLPSEYFARLAKISAAFTVDDGSDERISDLWLKLCRTGHVDLLSKEITALLLDPQHRSFAARRVARLSGSVLSERLIRGIVSAINTSLALCDDLNLQGLRAAAAICWMVHELIEAGFDKTDIVGWLVGDISRQQQSSMAANGSVALALMTLSGCEKSMDAGNDWLSKVPSRVYPSLLSDALSGVLIPRWSFSEFLQRASLAEMQAATALVMVCVGALSDKECGELAKSAEFMQAVPRFLDSPIPVVKLSGILVADLVTKRGFSSDGDDEKLDFGLADIVANAKTSQNQVLVASAQYVEQMQKLAAAAAGSPLQMWTRQAEDQDISVQTPPENDYDVISETRVVAPRQQSLTDGGASTELQSAFVRPRKPMFLGDCIKSLRGTKDGSNNELVSLALFAAVECIDKAGDKALLEHWLALANRVLYAYNRGKDEMDLLWNDERRRVLARLAVRLPELAGPFLADRSCDRNLTLKDREIVFSAIFSACIELSGLDSKSSEAIQEIKGSNDEKSLGTSGDSGALGQGTVLRRSKKLDLQKKSPVHASLQVKKYQSIVGPAFFFPLISQYGKSDLAHDTVSDVRRDASQLEKLINTLGIILYTAGSATHLIAMNREFWDLTKLVRRQLGDDQPVPVVDAVLFGIDVILDPQRALSVPTLAREFRNEIADCLRWIDFLAEKEYLRGSAMTHAARIVDRLREIQDQVSKRITSNDFDLFSSIV
ncbi:telomere binding protein [Coemansia asiatica]|nr:telomere binding protein [Coemansia asiatica]